MTNVKRVIGQMTDVKELREIERAAAERRREMERRAFAAKVAEAWERVKNLPAGTVLHVCTTGTFFGGPFQRGDSVKVTYIQPKARRVWIEYQGKVNGYYFDAANVERYDLRTEPPANPMTPEARECVERAAGRLAEAGYL